MENLLKGFRPTVLLALRVCVFGKIMEKLVTNGISYYVEKKNLLAKVQTGFHTGKSSGVFRGRATVRCPPPLARP